MSLAPKAKLASRLLVAVEHPYTWRTLQRVAANSHEICRGASEADVRERLAQPVPVSLVIVEPLVGSMSGLKVLDLSRELQPQALRVVVSNFSEISLLIEGVHNGLVQRILGLPLIDAEIRSLLTATTMTGSPAHPPMSSFDSRAAIAAAH